MRKLIFILVLVAVSTTACKAQNIIKSIYDDGYLSEQGVYYKDTYNDYDTFEGTWIYTNGNTTLTIVLMKKELKHIYDSHFNYYADAIVGEYRYEENGVEVINTLNNLTISYDDPYEYNIIGGTISKAGDPLCYDCGPNDKKVYCSFSDPTCNIQPTVRIIFRSFQEDGLEKLYVKLSVREAPITGLHEEEPYCDVLKVPYGEYVLVKQ